jgi:exodeoxyribonuclease VII small subunit
MADMATDPQKLSYEDARNELVEVVAHLENGTPTLEETISLWERGEALAARCEEWLIGAKERLTQAKAATTGTSRAAGKDSSEAAAVQTSPTDD